MIIYTLIKKIVGVIETLTWTNVKLVQGFKKKKELVSEKVKIP